MKLHAYKVGSLQDARSLLADACREGLSLDELIELLDRKLPTAEPLVPAAKRSIRKKDRESLCPSCGRFVMVPPKGVTEPVLVCPRCHYSEYRGVR